ncbi:cohesin domain-containing protein [Clostridium cellulovorans]|uniref:Uncharacterized protein n=1 Tax=Clostridium cellulovorans (strain ATCC 35296 / DSM 3052 / OCM 3 / 743B) TaxID=573061 RepID=D9SUN1_CLOC7|nr:hypothetical protein [Clostridium cellulovorans]ADL50936.1 hypothetical protein Clocel_1180 [Clostridium cellulovorans 743B]
MKSKKRICTLLVAMFMFLVFVSPNVAYAEVGTTQATPTLTATPNNEGNYISLKWTAPDPSKSYSYMIYSKKSTEAEFQSIPAKGTVKALNIYPNPVSNTGLSGGEKDLDGNSIPDSGILKTWLAKENINTITIESVSLTSFNSNPSKYLAKSNGKWNYDSVFYGMWNLDPQNMYPNDTAIEYLRTFINDGGGFMTSHHTIGYMGLDRGVNKLAKELGVEIFGRAQANIIQPYTCRDANGHLFPTVSFEVDDPSSTANADCTSYWNSSTKVQLGKSGLLNNYPFKVGNIGDTFDIPYQHGLSVFGKGDIWMTSVNPLGFVGIPFKEITISPSTGAKGTNNFYLHTYNNTAIINSGHSFPQITQAETRIIANTLYYLSQVTNQTSWDDHKGQDVDSPTKPNITRVAVDKAANKTNITFEPSTDKGTIYDYYIQAKELITSNKTNSEVKSTTITSGLKGYSIVVDKNPSTIPGNTITTTSPSYSVNGAFTEDCYIHVAAVDNVGNVSEVSHYKYTNPVLSMTLTPSTTELQRDPVTIIAVATSTNIAIAKIQTPDGNWVDGATANYDVNENGDYKFTAVDELGNQITQSITISNIIPKPVLSLALTPSITADTNGPVTISATATSTNTKIIKVQTPDGKWVDGSTVDYVVSSNGTYKFTAVDELGYEVTESVEVNNIFKVVLNVEPERNRIHLNETVTANLTIDNIKEIAAEDIRIKYDTTKLQFLGYEQVDGIKLMKSSSQNGELRFILVSKGLLNVVNSKTILLKLKFKGIAPGDGLVDVTKGRVSDGILMEKNLKDVECGQVNINVADEELIDVNADDEFSLLDLGILGRHLGEDPADLPEYNADVVLNDAIDDEDLAEVVKFMLLNPNYNF